MEIRSKYMSSLRLDEIIILESCFKRSEGSLENIEIGFDVKREIEKKSEEQYDVILDVLVEDDDKNISVFVKCKGKFSTRQENIELVERNAIAIMFPYIRSYISIITTQPSMQPIVLPAMNIVAMLNDRK